MFTYFSTLNFKTELNRKHNGQLLLRAQFAGGHIHKDIATCNTEEPQQRSRLGTVSNRLLGA